MKNFTTAIANSSITNIFADLKNDEAGFVISAELVLVATIAVLGMIVGLSELSYNVNEELEDVGSAVGSINQSYEYHMAHGRKGCMDGSRFHDAFDKGDGQYDLNCDAGARSEGSRK